MQASLKTSFASTLTDKETAALPTLGRVNRSGGCREAARDIYEVIEQFGLTEASSLVSFQLLVRVFDEQCEVVIGPDASVAVRPARKSDCDGVMNPADPDARYNKHRGVGYLVQIMETYAEDDLPEQDESTVAQPDLITHVSVGKLTMHDQDALELALDDVAQRGMRPQQLLADSHYGSKDCLTQGQQRGVEIVSPAMTAKGSRQGKLTLEDFELDNSGRIVRCPEGHALLGISAGIQKLQVVFPQNVCEVCSRCKDCPAAAVGRTSSRFQYTPARVRQRERRLREDTDSFRARYRWRAGNEATMSRFKHQMAMARLRVRGMASVTYTALLRALGLNIIRVAAYRTAGMTRRAI